MKKPSQILSGQPSYDLAGHLEHVRTLHAQYPLNTKEKCEAHTIALMKKIFGDKTPWLVLQEIHDCIAAIYSNEGIYDLYPTSIQDRDYLTRRQRELSSTERIAAADGAIVHFFTIILSAFPEVVFSKDDPTGAMVPLSVLTSFGSIVNAMYTLFPVAKYGDHRTFSMLAHQLTENMMRISGIDPERPTSRTLVPPLAYDGDPAEYLIETPFKELFETPVPFSIPRKTWASHGIILAPPNHGKTQLLGSLVAGFLQSDNPVGCFVLDPHGDLFSNLRERVAPDRLVTLDPDTSPPPLNFLDFGSSTEAQTLQTFSYLMSSLSGGLSDKQGAIVPYLLKLLRKIPGASIETLRQIVDEKVKNETQSIFHEQIRKLDPVDQGFFHNQFYSSRMQETKEAIGWRLYAALSNNTFREMFSAKTNSFDAWKAMQERKVVLVKGSENTLGEAGAPIFLQFIVAQAMQASFRRAALPDDDEHRPLCLLIIDEAKHVFNDQTERILTECRKWRLGFLAATQLISQIPENVRTAIYGATAIKISGPVADSDAEQLRKEMYCSKEFIRSMKAKERSHADWAFYVTGMTDKAVRVTVPYGAVERMPMLAIAPAAPSPPYLEGLERMERRAAKPEIKTAPTPPAVAAPTDPPIIPEPDDDDVHSSPMKKA